MVLKSTHFDPKVLLSAPRRSAGIPSPDCSRVLHTTSKYDFKAHKKDSELRFLNVTTGESKQLALNADVSDPAWLDDDHCLCLKSGEQGWTEFCIYNVNHTDQKFVSAGSIDAPAANLKVVRLDGGHFAVIVSAQASSNGTLFNSEKAKKTHSTGRLFTGLFVRHWDSYEVKEKNALWYAKLSKQSEGKWKLGSFHNALLNLGLESPIQPLGGTDNFDACTRGIVFVAKDPDLNPALNTKTNVYFVNIQSWAHGEPRVAQRVVIPGFEGASTSPVISPDGCKAAFLSMRTPGYEADKNQIFVMPCPLGSLGGGDLTAQRAFATETDGGNIGSWDRSPGSIVFTADSKHLVAIADDRGRSKLFMMKADFSAKAPYTLTCKGSVSDARPMANGNIFISGSSMVDNSFYAIVVPVFASENPSAQEFETMMPWINTNSGHGNKFGLSSSQVSSIMTPASNPKINKEVYSYVIRPSYYNANDKNKKYPVAYIIHGGPQGAWQDAWSTRWNPAVFAEQGYVVIFPNPTGSTGYGQAFTDAIQNNWGGDPYQDIVNVFEWVGKNLPEADNSRAVALGASYGGYMMSWIQGHDLGRKMKCLVWHDGITTFAGGVLPTDELYFPFHDLGGAPWYKPRSTTNNPKDAATQSDTNFGSTTLSDWRRWDPSEHLNNWSTPELVIHSARDFRLPIAEGLATFNILQARGVESQFLTFPDEGHWVLKPENSLVWHKTVLNWINKHVGLPAYSNEDPESDEYYGGIREEGEEIANMMTQGDVTT